MGLKLIDSDRFRDAVDRVSRETLKKMPDATVSRVGKLVRKWQVKRAAKLLLIQHLRQPKVEK